MPRSTALLISSDPALVEVVAGLAAAIPDLELLACGSIGEGCRRVQAGGVVLVLVHLSQGPAVEDLFGLLRRIADSNLSIATLVLSDRHQPEQALLLLRRGAADYLSRPLDLGRLSYLIDVLTVRSRYHAVSLAPAPEAAVQAVGAREPFLFSADGDFAKMMAQIQRIAPQDTTVLLNGETGTGKTKLAQVIHELSPRRDEPFLVINCGALSPSLMESEIFGHVRGAFTGADRDRAGKFKEVGRGTLLLDDIDGLSLGLQAKLLRAVEERVFEPVGGNQSLPMQARLIVSSSRNLEREAAEHRFRADLFYRLNVVAFHMPPLRERPRQVIEAIAHHFMRYFAPRTWGRVKGFVPAALHALTEYHWPGNVRELRNAVERAVALCLGERIQIDDLPQTVRAVSSAVERAPANGAANPAASEAAPALGSLAQTKEEAEAACILAALQRNNNNRLRAAAELGISRMTLYKKLHRYGLISAGGAA